jgi:hypothetical protein
MIGEPDSIRQDTSCRWSTSACAIALQRRRCPSPNVSWLYINSRNGLPSPCKRYLPLARSIPAVYLVRHVRPCLCPTSHPRPANSIISDIGISRTFQHPKSKSRSAAGNMQLKSSIHNNVREGLFTQRLCNKTVVVIERLVISSLAGCGRSSVEQKRTFFP